MQLKPSKRILLVGATGYVGRKLAHLLLTNTEATLILSGRSSVKLNELRSSLPMHDLADRTQLLELDATALDLASVPEFDLLVNATANGRHNTSLIEACLEHRADWIDMQTTNELLKPQADLQAEIERVSPGRLYSDGCPYQRNDQADAARTTSTWHPVYGTLLRSEPTAR